MSDPEGLDPPGHIWLTLDVIRVGEENELEVLIQKHRPPACMRGTASFLVREAAVVVLENSV